MNWHLGPLKKYVVFKGRASRKEYWPFLLISMSLWGILAEIFSPIGIVYFLPFLFPNIVVGVRRLHDTNHRGRWWLLNLIPIANIWILVLMVIKGTVGDNDYGPSDKYPHANDSEDDFMLGEEE